VGDNLRSLNLLVSVIGNDKKMIDVNKDDIANVRNTLINLPKGVLLADTRLDKKYINPIHDTKNDEKLSYTTQDKYFTMIRSFLKWAVDEELIPEMPGRNIKLIKNPKSDRGSDREPYSMAQLEKIFASPLYTGSKSHSRRVEIGNFKTQDAYYWIPLVALFSGMRLGEIVQLSTHDLKFENDVWFFYIGPDADSDKSFKTKTSVRKVPVHNQLINLGFIEYYKKIKAAKRSRIFYEIDRSASGDFSGNFSKWWSRYMAKTKIGTASTTFHSFRHNFIDALREANVHEDIRRSLAGHTAGNSSDAHSNYGHGTSIKRLKIEIDKLDYPFLHTH
jgi:integrase